MTSQQITMLTNMRSSGAGYQRIANTIGVSKDAVKKYCQRHGMRSETGAARSLQFCPNCGIRLVSLAGKKAKRFCSDRCRYSWWNAQHRQEARREAL